MNLLYLSWKNTFQKPLSASLSLLLLALGVGIILLLLQVQRETESRLLQNIRGIDMVIGAKGSPLQLILSSVYQVDYPTGNIPLEEAEKWMAHPLVKRSVPLAFGDNFKGYRILGTDTSYLSLYRLDLAKGRYWETEGDIVLGAGVAERLNLQIGDRIESTHGLQDQGESHEEHELIVVGILHSTQAVAHQLILTGLETIYSLHHSDTVSSPSLTSVLISFRSKMGLVMLPRMINEQTGLQAAVPAIEINRVQNLMGIGVDVMRALSFAIILIAGLSIFISLYSSLRERKYELALMRTLGAGPWKIFWLLILEGLVLVLLGFIVGWSLSKLGYSLFSARIGENYRVDIEGIRFYVEEVWILVSVLVLGFFAAFIPAIGAYRINLSTTLAER